MGSMRIEVRDICYTYKTKYQTVEALKGMGTGKSSCAINLMNEDTEHNYIYITPYLSEADRIAKACSGRRFMTPQHNGVVFHVQLSHTWMIKARSRKLN